MVNAMRRSVCQGSNRLPIATFAPRRICWFCSIERNASEAANKPIITGINGTFISSTNPPVNRGKPPIGSRPIVAISNPPTPAISPLISDSPEILAIMLSPKVARAKDSEALNFSAQLASTGERNISTIMLSVPPLKEENVAALNASPAFPCFVSS